MRDPSDYRLSELKRALYQTGNTFPYLREMTRTEVERAFESLAEDRKDDVLRYCDRSRKDEQ